VRLLSALYLLWVLITTTLGSLIGVGTLCHLFSLAGPPRHPLIACVFYVGLFVVLFFQGLLLHLRIPSNGVLLLGFGLIEGILLAGLHFLG